MEHKHTRGEWSSKQNGRFMPMDGWSADHEDFTFCAAAPIKAAGNVIAIAVYGCDEFDPEMEELKANATLIAAAPDLLEALLDFVHFGRIEATKDQVGILQAIEKARAAIAKATGETP